MPFLPLEHPEALSAIGDLHARRDFSSDGRASARAYSGRAAFRMLERHIRAFNSLMVFDDAGGLASVYDKTHLVPFGEYLPLQPLLESIGLEQLTRMRGRVHGGSSRPAAHHGRGIASPGGGLICYEAIFPD